MELVVESRIDGEFEGWDGDRVFPLINGQKWQQARYKYRYRYRYMPKAKIWREGSRHYLEVDGIDEMIEVRRLE